MARLSVMTNSPLIVSVPTLFGFGQETSGTGASPRGQSGLTGRGTFNAPPPLVGFGAARDSGAKAIEAMLAAANKPSEGIWATVIGVATLVFAAIGVVVQLKDALNTVWELESPRGSGIWRFARTYVLSFVGVLALGFLLIISMLVTTALSAAGKYVAPYMPEAIFQAVSFLVSLAVISLLFAMMFKWLPDAKIAWGDVWVVAV
jgi:membrane protein